MTPENSPLHFDNELIKQFPLALIGISYPVGSIYNPLGLITLQPETPICVCSNMCNRPLTIDQWNEIMQTGEMPFSNSIISAIYYEKDGVLAAKLAEKDTIEFVSIEQDLENRIVEFISHSKPHLTLTAGIFKQPYEISDIVYGYHQLVLENTWSQYSPLDNPPLL